MVTFILSCSISSENKYVYMINNSSDKELKVYYRTAKGDSTVYIQPQTQGEILNGVDVYVGDAPFSTSLFFLEIFDELKIEATDSSSITLDYLSISNWKSSKTSINIGSSHNSETTYKIVFANSDFR